jgi:hypothetical protein
MGSRTGSIQSQERCFIPLGSVALGIEETSS